MDRWNPAEGHQLALPTEDLSAPALARPEEDICAPSCGLSSPCLDSSQRVERGVKDTMAARKVQKADREKLRRDRLNEQFLELGNALDPDRPKNDKATILSDAIHMMKDLMAQVDKLKSEFSLLSEESSELTQEKNELREEKAALKSEIDSLNAQYQQRMRVVYPWAGIDGSMIMGPPQPYPFPMSIPVHPSIQPYQFFHGHPHGPVPGLFVASSYPHGNPHNSHTGGKNDDPEKSDDIGDVATKLELKMPGSTLTSSDSLSRRQVNKARNVSGQASSSSKCSSSYGVQDSSSSNGSVD